MDATANAATAEPQPAFDVWWLLRVKVPVDGGCIPYQLWLMYHAERLPLPVWLGPT